MKHRALLSALLLLLVMVPPGLEAATAHLEGYIPAAAHGEGRFESFWTTDLWIYHQDASVLHLWFNPAGRDNSDGESVVVELDAPVVQISDVVGSLFATEGIGSLHYLADGPVRVVSRTWTPASGGGSYGQTIPGIALDSAATAGTGQAGALRMLVDQSPSTRANLGLVNVSPVALTAVVEIFTADGEAAPGDSSFELELAPFDMTQIGDVLNRLEAGEREGLIIRVGVSSDEGGLMAYLSEVDNTTNDASYQEGFRYAF